MKLHEMVARHLSLRRISGGRWTGLCPFHKEKTPSFYVFEDDHYHCFGCGEHGGIVAWLTKIERIPEAEAKRVFSGGLPPRLRTRAPRPEGKTEETPHGLSWHELWLEWDRWNDPSPVRERMAPLLLEEGRRAVREAARQRRGET